MLPLNRRDLIGGALIGAAAASVSHAAPQSQQTVGGYPSRPWKLIDTNISLFQWPFRRLPYDTTEQLVGKLDALGVWQAWAGSFEGLLHRDVRGVNQRLAEACHSERRGRLIPFGSVNLDLPGWEEDVRRCHEQHRMPGVRIHPGYHGYTLDDSRFSRLLEIAAERRLLVQLSVSMEDRRTQHPKMQVPDVDLGPLPDVMQKVPGVKVLLLNYKPTASTLSRLANAADVYLDIARVEGTNGVSRLIHGISEDRVVFGSHAPFLIYESALIKVYESELTESASLALFEQNASRLIATG